MTSGVELAVPALVGAAVAVSATRLSVLGPRKRPLVASRREVRSTSPDRTMSIRRLAVPMRSGRIGRHVRGRRDRWCAPAAVAAWCDDLARLVRSGTSLRDALLRAVPSEERTCAATEPIRRALRVGEPAASAVASVHADQGPHLLLARQVLDVTTRLGGSPSAAIDRTAVVLRQRAADGHERVAQAAQARMSAHVLTALPVAVLAILAGTDPDVRTTLASPLGAGLVGVGLTLNVAGWCWMRRLVKGRR